MATFSNLMSLKRTEFFNGEKFVPYHVGFYVRAIASESGHYSSMFSHWDGIQWFDAQWADEGFRILNRPAPQNCDFQGVTINNGIER